jgi:hypothetical protein
MAVPAVLSWNRFPAMTLLSQLLCKSSLITHCHFTDSMSAVWLSNLRHPIMVIRGQSCAASFAECPVLPIFSQLPCPCCLVTAVLSWHGVPAYTCCLDLALKGNRVRFAYSSYHQLTPFEAPYLNINLFKFCSEFTEIFKFENHSTLWATLENHHRFDTGMAWAYVRTV